MNWEERIASYDELGFPKSLFIAGDGRVVGTWILGNDYHVSSGYYGGYPPTYLRRLKALFPDRKRVVHLFAGKVDTEELPGLTVDCNPELKPDIVDDCHDLGKVGIGNYNLVAADCPYSQEDAEHYGTPMIKRRVVFRSLMSRLTPGTYVAWLDQVLPQWRKDKMDLEGVIGIVKSSNHRFRVLSIFRQRGD